MTETPRPDPWKDVPLAIRREAHECATSNGRINPEYLAGLYRRGAQARTVVDHNGEVLTQAAVDRLLIDRGEQAETIRQLQATLPELHEAIERQSAQIAALTDGTAMQHARKQADADGFQRGWHAAVTRVAEGDSYRDLAGLVPIIDERVRDRLEAADARCATLTAALEELYATVKGECPSLLNEDSGGSAQLDAQVSAALAAAPQGGKP